MNLPPSFALKIARFKMFLSAKEKIHFSNVIVEYNYRTGVLIYLFLKDDLYFEFFSLEKSFAL